MTHLDDHIERLRQQMQRLNEEVRQATGESEASPISDSALTEIKQQVESEKEAIKKLREESADHTPRVVIVPHKGPNGTDRRPVYLECRADGITIWPEGSQIPLEFLENAGYSANPLDAALRTIRMHVDADLWRLGPSLSIAGGPAGWDRLLWRGTSCHEGLGRSIRV